MASDAVSHLLAARSLRSELSAPARSILLPATVADLLMQRLQRHGGSPFDPDLNRPLGLQLQLAVAWRGLRGTY